MEWDEFSRTETSVPSDSDGGSDYVTGLEDFSDNSIKTTCQQTRDMFEFLGNPSHTSSFIQSILYEDSCAGVAVVDLFVAVKIVKDKMDILAKCNNEILEKVIVLNRETRAIRAGYKNLIENIKAFLIRISGNEPKALINQSSVECRKQESSEKRPSACNNEALSFGLQILTEGNDGTCDQKQNLTENCKGRCHCCGRTDIQENLFKDCSIEDGETRHAQGCWYHRRGKTESKIDCIGCILSKFSGEAQNKGPIRNEALIGSFIASLLWLQIKDKNFCKINSKVISQIREELKKNEGSLGISESQMKMISDICGILRVTDSKKLESKKSDFRENVHGSNLAKREDNSTDQKGGNKVDCEEKIMIVSNSRGSLKSREDTDSDGESVFEEALADISMPPRELMRKYNVTCMGDLSNDLEKKNVGTFTANSNAVPSWIDKLTNDIKSKVKAVKSKTNVTVVERPFQKSNKILRKLTGAFEFIITANTPLGVFDVTVLQYQKRRRSKDFSKKIGRLVQGLRSKEPSKHRQLPSRTTNVKDSDYFLEDDLHNSDLESIEGSSNSGEDELEEFMDIYVENSNKNDKAVAPIRQKVESKISVLKLVKSPYFEIHKCYPIFFVQEIVRKKPKIVSPEHSNRRIEQKTVSLKTGEKQQKEMIIRRSSSDLVIYIQVEIEDGQTSSTGDVFVEYQKSSHGTQTRDAPASVFSEKEKVIKLEEEQQDGESLYNIWRDYDAVNKMEAEEKKMITFSEPLMIVGEEEREIKEEDLEQNEEKMGMIKEPKEKTVTFNDVLTEIFTEREIEDTYPEEEKENFPMMCALKVLIIMNAKCRADVWLLQNESTVIQRAEIVNAEMRQQINHKKNPQQEIVNFVGPIDFSNVELEKALVLIREIENDVKDIKLSDAVSILPHLESELRKHIQNKMKSIKDIGLEKERSVDNFFSAVDFWSYERSVEEDSDNSEEKLNSLLKLLSDLEQAVRANEYPSQKLDLCKCSSSIVYGLLHALTKSIRELEEIPNVTNLSQAVDIASQLDTAVRKYDNVIKNQSLNFVSFETERDKIMMLSSNCLDEVLMNEHLKSVRKKVFEKVEEEAIDMEGRIERDFDRLDRLEKENNEAMMFLEAFLQKTERRAVEFKDMKRDLQEMTLSVNTLLEEIVRTKEKELNESKDHSSLSGSSKMSTVSENEPVRETISGLLIALDSLKTRVKEKNEICKEILYSVGFDRTSESEKSSRRSSRSSFTAKQVETITSTVKDFKKIGETSLYLSWSKPKSFPNVSVSGYEIYVNGKLNQKVRNPQRLQAVLYSVDLSKEIEIHLYALVESEPKILLATVAYRDM